MDIYDKYLADRKFNGVEAGTLRNYELQISAFCEWTGVDSLDGFNHVTRLQYKEFTKKLLETRLASTVNNWIRGIDAFLWSLYDDEILKEDTLPSTKFASRRKKYYKEKKKESIYLDDKTLDAMQDACKTLGEKLFLATVRSTGTRYEEASLMKLSQIESYDKKDGSIGYKILLRKTKGQKPRYVALFPEIVEKMKDVVKTRNDGSDYVFVGTRGKKTIKPITNAGVNKRVKRVARIVLGDVVAKDVHIHLWRKAFATERLKRGYTMQQVGIALGHSTVSSKNNGGNSVTNRHYNLMNGDVGMEIFECHPIRI